MAKYNLDQVEQVRLIRATWVKVEGSKKVEHFAKGSVVEVSGNDKSQLLATGSEVVKGQTLAEPVGSEKVNKFRNKD